MIWLGIAAWYAVGVWSHIYWLRNKYDYKSSDIGSSAFSGLIGPAAFWVGWSVYGDRSETKVLLRKRS